MATTLTPTRSLFEEEIASFERAKIYDMSDHEQSWIESRYARYRRLGLTPKKAVLALRNYMRNSMEQAERRRSHDTGCEK